MPVTGKMEITIKINQFPDDVKIAENGWQQFVLQCGDQEVSVTLRPKNFNKMKKATESYPEWVAAISGSMGGRTSTGFVLENPNVQVFERKPKQTQPPDAQTTGQPPGEEGNT